MPTIAAAVLCLVVGVADGDTLTMRCDDQTVKVRLAEIDAPEKRQPWGTRSRQALADLCFQQQATLRAQKLDRYGRTVGRVECAGQDASQAQAAAGLAWAYRRYLTDADIASAEAIARAAHLGLWADPAPVPPWEWRCRRGRDVCGSPTGSRLPTACAAPALAGHKPNQSQTCEH